MSAIANKEQTIKFIKDYKSLPELWKTDLKAYSDKHKRSRAMNYLCKKYNLEPIACRNKIKSLRSYFCKEYQKSLTYHNNASSASEDEYVSSWFAYEHLLFLANDAKFEARVEVNISQLSEDSAEESDEKSIKAEDDFTENVQKLKNPEKKAKKVKHNNFNKKTKKAYNSLKKVVEFIQKRDELTIFGEHVASQIRNLNDKRRQCIAQYNINNILFQLSMENYSSQSPDTVTPSSSSSGGFLLQQSPMEQSSLLQYSIPQCTQQSSNNIPSSQTIEFAKF